MVRDALINNFCVEGKYIQNDPKPPEISQLELSHWNMLKDLIGKYRRATLNYCHSLFMASDFWWWKKVYIWFKIKKQFYWKGKRENPRTVSSHSVPRVWNTRNRTSSLPTPPVWRNPEVPLAAWSLAGIRSSWLFQGAKIRIQRSLRCGWWSKGGGGKKGRVVCHNDVVSLQKRKKVSRMYFKLVYSKLRGSNWIQSGFRLVLLTYTKQPPFKSQWYKNNTS